MKRFFLIILASLLCSFWGITTAQNHVSNIRVQQHDGLLYITYDLAVRADIEVHVSFDNGEYYKGPLKHVTGAVGEGIFPENNKIMVWNVFTEFGEIDYSNVLIKIIADPVDRNIQNNQRKRDKNNDSISSEYSKFSLGINYGWFLYNHQGFQATRYGLGYDHYFGFIIGLNGAYFFNRQLGLGFTAHYGQYDTHYSTDRRNFITFFGPVFYGNWNLFHRKLFFPTSIGAVLLNHVYKTGHDLREDGSQPFINWIYEGVLFSLGISYRPIDLISIGMSFRNIMEVTAKTDFLDIFGGDDLKALSFDLNFHF